MVRKHYYFNYTTHVQNNVLARIWRVSVDKRVNVNVLKSSHKVSKRLRILDNSNELEEYGIHQ